LDFETYLKLRDTDEETFMEEEVRPAAKQRLERTLVTDALVEAEGIKLDQDMLQKQINAVMSEVFYSSNAKEMQDQMGKEEFSRAISMEGVHRTINNQIMERLKLIATGQPIPEEEEEVEGETQEAPEGDVVDDENDVKLEEEQEEVSTDVEKAELVEPADEKAPEEDKKQPEKDDETSDD
jgi:hypothetical protein